MAEEENTLDLQFVATPEVIEDLRGELANHAEAVEIMGSGPVTDATDLSFDLGQVADLIAVIKDTLPAMGVLVTALYTVFQKRPAPVRIIMKSPLGDYTFEGDMSEKEIRAILRKLTEV